MVVILILVILAAIFEIYLAGQQIAEQKREVDDIRISILSQYQRRSRFTKLLDQYHKISEEQIIQELEEILPDTSNFLSVIEELEEIADISNSELEISLGDTRLTAEGFEIPVRTNVKKGTNGYDVVSIDVSLRGDFEGIQEFLNLFYQSKYFMNITQVLMNKVDNQSGEYLDTHLKVDVFVSGVIYDVQK